MKEHRKLQYTKIGIFCLESVDKRFYFCSAEKCTKSDGIKKLLCTEQFFSSNVWIFLVKVEYSMR
jgi:hypothetical protein